VLVVSSGFPFSPARSLEPWRTALLRCAPSPAVLLPVAAGATRRRTDARQARDHEVTGALVLGRGNLPVRRLVIAALLRGWAGVGRAMQVHESFGSDAEPLAGLDDSGPRGALEQARRRACCRRQVLVPVVAWQSPVGVSWPWPAGIPGPTLGSASRARYRAHPGPSQGLTLGFARAARDLPGWCAAALMRSYRA